MTIDNIFFYICYFHFVLFYSLLYFFSFSFYFIQFHLKILFKKNVGLCKSFLQDDIALK